MLAKLYLHELAHVFVTFLRGGLSDTLPHVTVDTHGVPEPTIGEAGRYIDIYVLGGLTTVIKDEKDRYNEVRSFLPDCAKRFAHALAFCTCTERLSRPACYTWWVHIRLVKSSR